jgi:hypothetical protein
MLGYTAIGYRGGDDQLYGDRRSARLSAKAIGRCYRIGWLSATAIGLLTPEDDGVRIVVQRFPFAGEPLT